MSKLDGQNEILIKFLRHLPKHYIHKNYMILDVGGSKSVANQIVQTVQYSPFVQWPDLSSQILKFFLKLMGVYNGNKICTTNLTRGYSGG